MATENNEEILARLLRGGIGSDVPPVPPDHLKYRELLLGLAPRIDALGGFANLTEDNLRAMETKAEGKVDDEGDDEREDEMDEREDEDAALRLNEANLQYLLQLAGYYRGLGKVATLFPRLDTIGPFYPPELKIGSLLLKLLPTLEARINGLEGGLAHLNVQKIRSFAPALILTPQQQEALLYLASHTHDLLYIAEARKTWRTPQEAIHWLVDQFLIPARGLVKGWQRKEMHEEMDRREGRLMPDEDEEGPRRGGGYGRASERYDSDGEESDKDDEGYSPRSSDWIRPSAIERERERERDPESRHGISPYSAESWIEAGVDEFIRFLPRNVAEEEDLPTWIAWFSVWVRERPAKFHTTSLNFVGMRFITGSGDKTARNFRNLMRRMRYLRDIYNVGVFFNFQSPSDKSKHIAHAHMIEREAEAWDQICSEEGQSPSVVVPCKFVRLPVPDWSAPRPEQLEEYVKTLSEADCGTCVAGHCTAGMGRTGSFVLTGVKIGYPDVVGFDKLCDKVGRDYRDDAKKELLDIYKAIHKDPVKGKKDHPRWDRFSEFISTVNNRVTRSWRKVLDAGAPLRGVATKAEETQEAFRGLAKNQDFLMASVLAMTEFLGKPTLKMLQVTMEGVWGKIWGFNLDESTWAGLIKGALKEGFIDQGWRSVSQWFYGSDYVYEITPKGETFVATYARPPISFGPAPPDEAGAATYHSPRFKLIRVPKGKRKAKRSRSVSKHKHKTFSRRSMDKLYQAYRQALKADVEQTKRLEILRQVVAASSVDKVKGRLKAMHDRRRHSKAGEARKIHSDSNAL